MNHCGARRRFAVVLCDPRRYNRAPNGESRRVRKLHSFEASLLRALGTLVSPGGSRASLLVLIYHRVLDRPDPLLDGEPDATRFAAEMDVVRSVSNVLPLAEAVERLASGSLPPRALSVTFDDGYANNRTIAAPILKERGIPATVFIATGFIGSNGRMWNDTVIESLRSADRVDLRDLGAREYELDGTATRRAAIDETLRALKHLPPEERLRRAEEIAARVGLPPPRDVMLTEKQIHELGDFGIDIGAHTVTHPILMSVAPERARREIADSKDALEGITRAPVKLFAYPNGQPDRDYDRQHVQMVRAAGFSGAVSTAWGAAGPHTDRYQLPRMLPWDKSPVRFSARLLRTYRSLHADTARSGEPRAAAGAAPASREL